MADIFYLSHIRFGFGVLAELGPALAGLGVGRPLLVTDAGIRATGLLERVIEACPVAAIFDGTPTNPTEAAVLAALDLYRSQGCDGVIGLGGGSPIDLAKGVALLATHPARRWPTTPRSWAACRGSPPPPPPWSRSRPPPAPAARSAAPR